MRDTLQKSLILVPGLLCLALPQYALARNLPTPLNEVINEILQAPEPDIYEFEGKAGEEITITAYFGHSFSSIPLRNDGRLQLIGPDGMVIAAPILEFRQFVFVIGGRGFNSTSHYSRIEKFVLPTTGLYQVKIDARSAITGDRQYWLTINNPEPPVQNLNLTETQTGAFAVRGALQEWELRCEAGKLVALSFIVPRQQVQQRQRITMESWTAANSTGEEIASGPGGDNGLIFFTPQETGDCTLRFSGAFTLIGTPEDLGPFEYVFIPAVAAPLNERIDESIDLERERDLYVFRGVQGQTITFSAYWGHSQGSGIKGVGTLRLLGENGATVIELDREFVGGTLCRVFCFPIRHFFSRLDGSTLPTDGTYIVEISAQGAIGEYWLGMSDPTEEFSPLAVMEVTDSAFGVRGDVQEWEFQAAVGEELGWIYEGDLAMGEWRIAGPSGTEVASGSGGRTEVIAFTPLQNGRHTLVFRDVLIVSLKSPEEVGPHPYQLIPDPENEEAAGSISGTVWYDINRNGSRDTNNQEAEEPVLRELSVELRDESDAVQQTTVTDSNGTYTFLNVPVGTYTVNIVEGNGQVSPFEVSGDVLGVDIGNTFTTDDYDEDALPDEFEFFGAVGVDLPAMGANPLKKDVFVEVDWMIGILGPDGEQWHKPQQGDMTKIVDAFGDAPVDNPDGTNGINLHIDFGPTSLNHATEQNWGTLSESTVLPQIPKLGCFADPQTYHWRKPLFGSCDGVDGYFDDQIEFFPEERRGIFHYVVFASRTVVPTGSKGYAGANRSKSNGDPVSSFIIFNQLIRDVATNPTVPNISVPSLFMHELGHSLSLQHGGQDPVNYKPNYLSVMNYFFDGEALLKNGVSGNIDYSRFVLETLDERSLDETRGLRAIDTNSTFDPSKYGTYFYCNSSIGTLPISPTTAFDSTTLNWDCANDSSNTNAQNRNINNDNDIQDALISNNDWKNLDFATGISGLGGSISNLPATSFVEEVAPEDDPVPTLHGVFVTAGNPLLLVEGSSGDAIFAVRNVSNFNSDTFTLEVESLEGFANTAGFPKQVSLAAGESATIIVPVSIPVGTNAETREEVLLTAQSNTAPLIASSAEVRVQLVSASFQPSIGGPSDGELGQSLSFVFRATEDIESLLQAADFSYEIDWEGDGIVDETRTGLGAGIEAKRIYTDVGSFTVEVIVTNIDSSVSADTEHPVTIVVGEQPSLIEIIQNMPVAVFEKEKTQRLTPLLNKAEAVDALIAEGKIQEAIDKLTNDLRKHAEDWLIDAEVQEGESTKEELIRTIDALIRYLELQ